MSISNVMEKIQAAKKIIDPEYSLTLDINADNVFALGYMQGVKAEQARIRKKEKSLTPYLRGIIEDCKSLDEKALRRIRITVGTAKGAKRAEVGKPTEVSCGINSIATCGNAEGVFEARKPIEGISYG